MERFASKVSLIDEEMDEEANRTQETKPKSDYRFAALAPLSVRPLSAVPGELATISGEGVVRLVVIGHPLSEELVPQLRQCVMKFYLKKLYTSRSEL